jgi:hypothetical protein
MAPGMTLPMASPDQKSRQKIQLRRLMGIAPFLLNDLKTVHKTECYRFLSPLAW